MLKIAFDPIYQHKLPEPHRFPMLKYELIPGQLLHEGTCTSDQFFAPNAIDEETILWTHTPTYWQSLKTGTIDDKMIRKIGFPWSNELVLRERIICQGTIDCCHFAIQNKVAMNVAGGTHHAFADKGEGFCLLNDVAIAANYLIKKQLASKILVIDLDVHQGNGTAKIFENNPNVFTFSMHGADNYPLQKEKSALDIALAYQTKDVAYLSILEQSLAQILQVFTPDFLFYISGVDILGGDKLGKLSVSIAGCKQRDKMVFDFAKKLQLPIVVAMGGGYSPDIKVIVEAHCNTFRLAEGIF